MIEASFEELTETRNAQLATFTLSLVILDAVERLGIEPARGWPATRWASTPLSAASGAIGFEEYPSLSCRKRSEAMQAAADAQAGVMTVISGCDAETVDIACRLADGEVWVANFNSPEETVIAGEVASVERAANLAVSFGARRFTPVAVGGAFHTPFMVPARDRLRKALATTTFHPAEIDLVANVSMLATHIDAADWPLLLSAQLCSPIRWSQSIMRLGGLSDAGADSEDLFVELGPGDSLSTMIRHTLPSVTTIAVSVPSDLDLLVDAMAGQQRPSLIRTRPPRRAALCLGAGRDQPGSGSLPTGR